MSCVLWSTNFFWPCLNKCRCGASCNQAFNCSTNAYSRCCVEISELLPSASADASGDTPCWREDERTVITAVTIRRIARHCLERPIAAVSTKSLVVGFAVLARLPNRARMNGLCFEGFISEQLGPRNPTVGEENPTSCLSTGLNLVTPLQHACWLALVPHKFQFMFVKEIV